MIRSISLLALLPPLAFLTGILTGKVVKVTDGDTIVVLDSANTQHRVRLEGIDAPERCQPFGTKSKENLSRYVAGKADCPRNLDAGMGQLASGMAWHFKRYASEQTQEQRLRYAFAEEEARAKKARLWINENPMPP